MNTKYTVEKVTNLETGKLERVSIICKSCGEKISVPVKASDFTVFVSEHNKKCK